MTEFDAEVRGAIEVIERYVSTGDNETSLADYVDELDETNLFGYFDEHPDEAITLVGELEAYFENGDLPTTDEIKTEQGPFPPHTDPNWMVEQADASIVRPKEESDDEEEGAIDLEANSVDLIVTSPPYWKKRDYGTQDQLGQESTPNEYIENLIDALEHWKTFLRPTGSIFLNIGDTYKNKSLTGIPGRFAKAAQDAGWTIRNEITWAKDNGIPSSAKDRLVPRHEPIYHLVLDKDEYYYDLHGYSNLYGNGSNPGDVWRISHDRNTGGHLAPFPSDLVQRAITLACPPTVCTNCGSPRRRIRKRGLTNLNTDRPQARRALEIYEESDELTLNHIRAIQATGISDVGKAQEFQSGAGNNDEDVQKYAKEAKDILGGYFREFTFPQWTTAGWTECDCDEPTLERGRVFDPFAGSGTTIQVALSLGYHGFGTDLDTSNIDQDQSLTTYSK
ncbi:site-specific DNA-methyltransferase [Haladaptatus sp. SPP-AMP-3]|uniref:DNA-methyltransferase n=1 Tax=Haladaptatus sp. SPP-AMP-3 TaxID=3121295 RepID=UPI003C2FCA34